GTAITGVAILRVRLGREPVESGEALVIAGDPTPIEAYRKALVLMAGIAVYYLGIVALGFLLASALYLLIFMRTYGQSLRSSLVATATSLAVVYGLSVALNLYLPWGWLELLF